RRNTDIVVDGNALNGILKEDVGGDVDAKIAVEGVVIDRAAGDGPSILAPQVNAVVMIGVRGRIPIGKIVEMVVVDVIAASLEEGAGGDAVIDVIYIGIFEGEIVAVAGDGPRGVMAGDAADREVIGQMPGDA